MDPIANMFSQIRNAQNAKKKSLIIPFSKMKLALLVVLKDRKYIVDFKEISEGKKEGKGATFKKIEITLENDSITQIQRVSKPGRRIYAASSRIPRRRSPSGLVIVSTSEGVMEGEDARKKGLGGEVVAEII